MECSRAPDAVVLIRLIQLIEETDSAWTRTERLSSNSGIGARTVRATAEQFQQLQAGRTPHVPELQLEYLQWYCDLLAFFSL